MSLSILIDVLGEIVAPSACAACDEPVGPRVLFCPACAASAIVADDGRAAFAYGGAIATAIARLKFRARPELGARLGAAMAEVAPRDADVVVPVPLHVRRLAERGFNQSALLASAYATRLGLRHLPRALARTRDTAHQLHLPRHARAGNVFGAFMCRMQAPLAGKRVLLVDDVTTTGATLEACADAVRSSGARRVETLALARREWVEPMR